MLAADPGAELLLKTRLRPPLRGILVALFLVTVVSARARAGVPEPSRLGEGLSSTPTLEETVQDRIAFLLRDGEGLETPEGRSRRIAELGSLGESAVLELFVALTRNVPTSSGATHLPEPRREILVEALARFERGTVLALAEEAVFASDPSRRAAGLIVLGALGSEAHVPLLFRAVRRPPAAEKTAPETATETLGAFELAVCALVQRDPSSLRWIRRNWPSLSPAAVDALVRAVGRAGSPAGAPLLVSMLERRGAAPVSVLSELSGLVRADRGRRSLEGLESVRRYLDPDDPLACQTTALILGSLLDFESVDDLIELLEEEHPGVRGNAYRALQEISGVALRCDAERWRTWYREEIDWFEREHPRVVQQLHAPDKSEVMEALRVIGCRRLFLDELAEDLRVVLDFEDPELCLLGARTLAALGRPAIPGLIEALDHPDDQISRLALDELRRLTGLELEASSREWSSALEERWGHAK